MPLPLPERRGTASAEHRLPGSLAVALLALPLGDHIDVHHADLHRHSAAIATNTLSIKDA
jgi:hypothetical protein